MSYWQDYRKYKENGLIEPLVVVNADANGNSTVAMDKAMFDSMGNRLPDTYREVMTIQEGLKIRAELQEQIADVDAWLVDAVAARDQFVLDRAAEIEQMHAAEKQMAAELKAVEESRKETSISSEDALRLPTESIPIEGEGDVKPR